MLERLQQWKMWRTIKQHRDNKTLLMGVSWFRPEQWDRLREISEDKENFEMTKVEVDVEALLTWCTAQGLAVTPETRTKFMMNTFRDLVRKGIVKP
jgi:hypothetical protein